MESFQTVNEATAIINGDLHLHFIFFSLSSLSVAQTLVCAQQSNQAQIPRLLLTGISQSGTQEVITESCVFLVIIRSFVIVLRTQVAFCWPNPRWSIMIIFLFPSSLPLSTHLLPFWSQTIQSSYSKSAHLTGRLHPQRSDITENGKLGQLTEMSYF